MKPLQPLLNLLFPPRCLGCRALGTFFCATCMAGVRGVPEPFCPTCHLHVDHQAPICRCRQPVPAYVLAAGEFSGPLREAIHRFKYQGQTAGAPALAALLRARIGPALRADHLLVPVALHPGRERQRGYNQAALLARELARGGNAVLAERALRRIRLTQPQVTLQARERARNMDGAFSAEHICHGRTVVLVDDVCTTGATLRAAALAVRAAGARHVYAAVLAATQTGPLRQETATAR